VSFYTVVVFIHVIGGITVVGGSLYGTVLATAVRQADSVAAVRQAGQNLATVVGITGGAAGVVILSGLFLAFRGGWWGGGWVEVALAMFAVAGGLAMGVVDPAAKRLVAELADVSDGPVTSAVDRLRRDPRQAVAAGLLVGVDVSIVFLMTNKPTLPIAVTAAAGGLALGGIMAARRRRQDTAALATATAA